MSDFEHFTLVQGAINLVIQAAIAVGSFAVAAMALWGDRIKDWWFGPSLQLSVQLEPPYCQKIGIETWFRVKVENTGKTAARDVELWITELSRHVGGVFLDQGLVPVSLIWTHTTEARTSSVNPSFHRYVDFGNLTQRAGHHYEGATSHFKLALHVVPRNQSSFMEPGMYAGRVAVTASNAPVRYWNFRFEVPASQMPTEAETLKTVNLRIVT